MVVGVEVLISDADNPTVVAHDDVSFESAEMMAMKRSGATVRDDVDGKSQKRLRGQRDRGRVLLHVRRVMG